MEFKLQLASVDDILKQDMSDPVSQGVADYADILTAVVEKEESYLRGHISFERFKDMVNEFQKKEYGRYPMTSDQYPILVSVSEDGILSLTLYDAYTL